MARFQIRDTFAIRDTPTFVLAGFVLEGKIEVGMSLTIPFNANVNMTAKIDRIDLIHRPDGNITCLCINCSVPDEATLWEALNVKGQTIEIKAA